MSGCVWLCLVVSGCVWLCLVVIARSLQLVATHYESAVGRAKAGAAKVEELTIAMGHLSRDLATARAEVEQLTQNDSEQQRELQRLERYAVLAGIV